MTPPIIYNLFPRLAGPTTQWSSHCLRARDMGFNWIFLNPWYYPGFSGSLYAPKDYGRMNPLFVPPGADEYSLEPLRQFLAEMRRAGMPVMMDLVINHTSRDSPLVTDHPSWFIRDGSGDVVSPSVRDPDDPSKVTTWGDLAEVDNRDSPDREALWRFWAGLVRDGLELGFSGFRCDAAYMVPSDLWRYLVEQARDVAPAAKFFAETLGAPVEQVLDLSGAGFDFFFNSSKWWNFHDDWALDQHAQFGAVAPSISFPESHDTARLASETGGDPTIQLQRYALAAFFSAGLMMPIGYEFGFRGPMNVVHTTPADWEGAHYDISDLIGQMNRLKRQQPVLQGEGSIARVHASGEGVVVLERRVDPLNLPAFLLVNTDTDASREVDLDGIGVNGLDSLRLVRVCREEEASAGSGVVGSVRLDRSEVAYLLPSSATGIGAE